jgi:hypothetical protein
VTRLYYVRVKHSPAWPPKDWTWKERERALSYAPNNPWPIGAYVHPYKFEEGDGPGPYGLVETSDKPMKPWTDRTACEQFKRACTKSYKHVQFEVVVFVEQRV